MGIIRKQAFYASIVQYAGMVIGYLNVVIILPNILSDAEFGLTRTILSIGAIYAQFGSLGFNRTISRFFPFFKTDDKKNRGFLFLALLVPMVGFLVITLLYLVFDDFIKGKYLENSPLFIDYYYSVIPFALLFLFGEITEVYLQATYKTILTTFLKNVLVRVFWMLSAVAMALGWIDFEMFMLLFVGTYSARAVVSILYLMSIKEFNVKPEPHSYRNVLMKKMAGYSFFSVLTGSAVIIVDQIDKAMISSMRGLDETGIFSIAAYLSAVVMVPAMSIARIAIPVVSQALKDKDIGRIERVYKNTSEIQLLIGGLLFLGIWLNIDAILTLVKPGMIEGKYVVLFIGLAKLTTMGAGINGVIISLTRWYKLDAFISVFLITTTIVSNLIFIPRWGINGAALASLVSITAYNIVMGGAVLWIYKIHPFTKRTVPIITLILGVAGLVYLLPDLDNLWLDIAYKSVIITFTFVAPAYFLKLSNQLNEAIDLSLKKVRNLIR